MATKRRSHPFDDIADEVLRSIEEDTDFYVEELRGDSRSPFSADVTEAEKMDYYRRQAFGENPDGTIDFTKVNAQGRQNLINRLGTRGYAEVMTTIKPPKGYPQMTGRDEDYDLTEDMDNGEEAKTTV